MSYYTHVSKVVVVGNSGVGKSCLVARFAGEDFEEGQAATIGVDFRSRIREFGEER